VALRKRDLYRFPWSMNDNAIAWLEVTDICNIHCEGCYRQKVTGHKSLEEIQKEVLFYKEWRNPDNISIAGGEPLIHPQIMEVVEFIAEQGIKPILLTNGVRLTEERVRELKRRGLAGFTIHVDSHQERPGGWTGKSEKELNALRQQLAEMIARVGGLTVAFNSTVYPSTAHEIPDVVRWGRAHADIVHGLVFITYRTATTESSIARSLEDEVVDLGKLSYATEKFDEDFVTSPEVYELIKSACPEYEASGYLGGTVKHDSYKWLAGTVIGAGKESYGALGKRGLEMVQTLHHLFKGTYLAYLSNPKVGAKIFLLAPWDREVRRALKRWLGDVVRHPWRLLRPIHMQSFGIIQAPDLQETGVADMCDSCPDMTYYDGKLVNSCRLDEYRLFGGLLNVVSRESVREHRQHLQEEAAAGGASVVTRTAPAAEREDGGSA